MLAGAPTEFWAYNGSLPGPLIEVTEGDTVEIDFENRLPQAATVHWHGLPVPAEQDGNQWPLWKRQITHFGFRYVEVSRPKFAPFSVDGLQ